MNPKYFVIHWTLPVAQPTAEMSMCPTRSDQKHARVMAFLPASLVILCVKCYKLAHFSMLLIPFDSCVQSRLVTAARGLCRGRPQCCARCWTTMTTLRSSCSHRSRSACQKTSLLEWCTLPRPRIQTMEKMELYTTPF